MAISLSPDNLTDYITNLEEVFRCYICLGRLQDTRLCPKCSKMCCFQCIRRWLMEQKPSCPHCRCSLLLHELVKCRWVDDLLGQLKNSQAKKDALTKDQCLIHSEQLSVYCVTCGFCVCHQCALWAGEHANHDFQPVLEIYERHKRGLYAEVNNLKKRLTEIHDSASDIDKQLNLHSQERERHIKQINKVMKDISSRIDMQISSQINRLKIEQLNLQKESHLVEGKIGEVLNKIETNAKSELIRSSPEILQELLGLISRLAKPPAATITPLGKELQVVNELIPSYMDGEFVIEEFSALRRRGSPIYSPPLILHGQVWKLKVYPDGNGIFKGEFLSVFLELNSGFPGSAKYEYRVSMVHVSGNADRTIYREFSSDFEHGECWGYNRFYRLEHLVTKGYVDSIEDNLKLQFSVRSPTFYHDSVQQQKQISALKEQMECMEGRLRSQEDSRVSESLVPKAEDETGSKHEESEEREGEDLTSEQLDRVLLFSPSFDNSDMSLEVEVLAPASDDETTSHLPSHHRVNFLSPEVVIPDSQESVDLSELASQLEEVQVAEGDDLDLREELDMTLVSDAVSDRPVDPSPPLTHTPSLNHSYENSQDMNDGSSSGGSEDNDLSIHSLDSPLPEAYWDYLPPEETTRSDTSEEKVEQLGEPDAQVETPESSLNPSQDHFVFATRYTDSLSTNFPNIQASILACLRDVSNNPLLGLIPSSLSPTTPPVARVTNQPPGLLDVLPLTNYDPTSGESEQDLISLEERDGLDSNSDSLPPE